MPITNLKRAFFRRTLLHKIFYFLAGLISISLMINYGRQQVEGFGEKKTNEFDMRTNVTEIYDDFYATIYDDLVYNPAKNDYEVGHLTKFTKPTKDSVILDIGSGTGHHVQGWKTRGFTNVQGCDLSPSMVKKAKEKYPDLKFQVADALNPAAFLENHFTHITCFYFTVYYIQDKKTFFANCMRWLKPNGILAVHLVNRDKFDPIIPAGNPFTIVSPQKYTKKRITTTTVQFDQFEYKSNFNLKNEVKNQDEPNTLMVETFKNKKSGNVRKNEHKLYMQTQAEILDIAKSVGFIIETKIDLLQCQYESQYIYVLQKPN